MPQNLPQIRLPRRFLALILLAALSATGVGAWFVLSDPGHQELDCPPLRMPEGSRPLCTASPLGDGPVSEQGSPTNSAPNCEETADLIENLESQAKRTDRRPAVLRNLAAAYCIAGRRDDRPDQLARGLEHWLEAEERAGRDEPAWTQEALGMCRELGVLCTDRQLAAVEPAPRPLDCEAFSAQLESLLEAPASVELERTVRARTWETIDALLCRFHKQATATPAEATRLAPGSRRLAEALSRVSGDPIWSEAMDHLEASSGTPGEESHRNLMEGLTTLARHPVPQLRGLSEVELDEAHGALATASGKLRSSGSPLWIQAELTAAVALYYNNSRCPALSQQLSAVLREPSAQPYPFLLARAHWILGTCSLYHVAPPQALEHYKLARSHFASSGLDSQLRELAINIGDAWMQLGQSGEEWQTRIGALQTERQLPNSASVRTLLTLSTSAGSVGWPHLADLWQREAIGKTAGLQDASRVHALRGGIATALRLQDAARAHRYLDEALEALKELPDGGIRKDSEDRLLEVKAILEAQNDPCAGLHELTQPLAAARTNQHRPTILRLLIQAATLSLACKVPSQAEEALAEAVALVVEEGRAVLSGSQRGTETWQMYAALHRPTFDQLVDLQVRLEKEEESFATNEIGRSRELNALLTDAQGLDPEALAPASLKELQQGLDQQTAYLAFMTLPNATVVWVVRKDAFKARSLKIPRAQLRRDITYLLGAVEARRREDVVDKLDQLHQELFAPVELLLQGIDRLVVIPDDALHGLPFAALRNRLTGEYLVESFTIETSPSASFHRDARARARTRRASRALVVSAPDFPKDHFPELSDLLGSAREAREIVGWYPQPKPILLEGPDATKAAVLSELASAEVFHFSGHSVAGPLRSYMVLAARDAEGARLEARELLALSLHRTKLAVLASCQSLGDPIRGAEGATSLVRPLLGAGVPTVVASLWKVPDQATSALMVELHRQYRKTSDAARALRLAQLQLLGSDESEAKDPRSWAGFVVIGAAEPTEVP